MAFKYIGLFEKDYPITSFYGPRTYKKNGKTIKDFHDGIDIGTPVGITGFLPGRSDKKDTGWKQLANAKKDTTKAGAGALHSNAEEMATKIILVCYHESAGLLPVGKQRLQGTPWMKTGKTGNVTGPHTHVMIIVKGKKVDPLPYFDTYKKNGITYVKGFKFNTSNTVTVTIPPVDIKLIPTTMPEPTKDTTLPITVPVTTTIPETTTTTNVQVVPQETVTQRVQSTATYTLPVLGVGLSAGVIISYFWPQMPAGVVTAIVTVGGYIFNTLYDLVRYYIENRTKNA